MESLDGIIKDEIPQYTYLELYSYSKSLLPIDPSIGLVCFLSALGGAEFSHRKLPHESRNYPDL